MASIRVRWFPFRFSVLLAAFSILGILQGCHSSKDAVHPKVSTAPEAAETSPTLFWLEDEPVTRKDIEDFVSTHLKRTGSHQMRLDVEGEALNNYIEAYLRYRVVVAEGIRNGIEEDPAFRHAMLTAKRVHLGREYLGFLLKGVELDPQEIKAQIPTQWTRMTFNIKVFESMASAAKAYEAIQGGADFEETTGQLALNARHSTTSKMEDLFRDSGFFDPLDDAYLFTLKEGDVSHPVRTGVGPAILRIEKRQDLDQQEQADFLADIRDKLSQRTVDRKVKEAVKKSGMQIELDAIQEDIEDRLIGFPPPERIFVRLAGEVISSSEVHYLIEENVFNLAKQIPRQKLAEVVSEDVKDLARYWLMGIEADEKNFTPDDEAKFRWVLEAEEERIRYDRSQKLLSQSLKVPPITDGEVEAYYRNNQSLYQLLDGRRISYYFSPQKDQIDAIGKQYKSGANFDGLRMPSTVGVPHESKKWPKTAFVVKDEPAYGDIQKELWAMKEGEVRDIEGNMGTFFVKVTQVRPAGMLPLNDVRKETVKRLQQLRMDQETERFIIKAVGLLNVRFSDVPDEKKVMPPLNQPETG